MKKAQLTAIRLVITSVLLVAKIDITALHVISVQAYLTSMTFPVFLIVQTICYQSIINAQTVLAPVQSAQVLHTTAQSAQWSLENHTF